MKQKTTLLPDWKKDKKLPQETINDIIENPKKYDGHWDAISMNYKLPEYFIRVLKNKLNLDCVSVCQTLSENFMEELEDILYWDSLSYHQQMSEKFIEKHQNKLYMHRIAERQKLSEKFIFKHFSIFSSCVKYLLKNKNLSITLKKKIIKRKIKEMNQKLLSEKDINWYYKL